MEEIIPHIALVASVAAIASSVLTALINITRLVRAKGDNLVVKIGKSEFIFDVAAPDHNSVDQIEKAKRAVEKISQRIG